jgi:malonyl-CoA/methylmalonyl-CoA synthetase
MGVPTMYSQLIRVYDESTPTQQALMSKSCRQFRVMISGSAALPIPTLERWHQISGHVLLERYGMTEIGMALSNPLHGTRRAGYVGRPLPLVKTKIKIEPNQSNTNSEQEDDNANLNSKSKSGSESHADVKTGELLISGPTVFTEYWNCPQATTDAFEADNTTGTGTSTGSNTNRWFKTGDIVSVDMRTGEYRITGRASVDILKSAGYKISALDVEAVLITHPAIKECAIVGVQSTEYGQIVSAIIATKVCTLPTAEFDCDL